MLRGLRPPSYLRAAAGWRWLLLDACFLCVVAVAAAAAGAPAHRFLAASQMFTNVQKMYTTQKNEHTLRSRDNKKIQKCPTLRCTFPELTLGRLRIHSYFGFQNGNSHFQIKAKRASAVLTLARFISSVTLGRPSAHSCFGFQNANSYFQIKASAPAPHLRWRALFPG